MLLVSLAYWSVISTWNPPKSLAWQKGFRLGSGLIWGKLGLLLLVCLLLLPVSAVGLRMVVMEEILFLVVHLLLLLFLSCKVQPDRWIAPHLAVRALFDYGRWDSWVTQPVRCTPFGLLLGYLLLIRLGVLSLLRFKAFGRFMMSGFSLCLVAMLLCLMSLLVWMMSLAWSVWSRAAESALADAFQFSGGPLPSRGLVLGRGAALFRKVQLGGHWVRRARANAADVLDAADVFLYCSSA